MSYFGSRATGSDPSFTASLTMLYGQDYATQEALPVSNRDNLPSCSYNLEECY
jgi:hypothetical protein